VLPFPVAVPEQQQIIYRTASLSFLLLLHFTTSHTYDFCFLLLTLTIHFHIRNLYCGPNPATVVVLSRTVPYCESPPHSVCIKRLCSPQLTADPRNPRREGTERDIFGVIMGKQQPIHIPNTYSPPRARSILLVLLLVLCIPTLFIRFAPNTTADIVKHFRSQTSFCSEDVGSPACCDLFLDASPCLDECRKEHVDRVTFTLTEEYQDCADTCLEEWTMQCQDTPRCRE